MPVVPELLRAKVQGLRRPLPQDPASWTRSTPSSSGAWPSAPPSSRAANAELEQRVEQRTREREAALAQVHEMQKMESLGQLTGGVAHDFNNLLMAIMGNLELLKQAAAGRSIAAAGLFDGAMQAPSAAPRSRKRMLAFARRQELKPDAVVAPELVDGMEEMLRRSLGPTIRSSTNMPRGSAAGRGSIRNQFELAMLNLALNARDAMPNGGRLPIVGAREDGRRPASPGPGGPGSMSASR